MKHKNFMLVIALMLVFSLVLSACGAETATPTATTAPAAAATDTPAAAAPTDTPAAAAPTDTPAAAAETPTKAAGGGTVGEFDASKVKKTEVEQGATLRISGWSSTPAELDIVRAQLDRFKQVYPDVTVNYEPNPDQYDAKLKAQVSGGTEPDVFYVNPQLADELIDANKLMKLNDYMSTAGISKGDYYESLIGIFSKGDDVYGLPKDFGSLAVFYNTDMAKEKPKADWTWDDYKTWAQANVQNADDPNAKVFGSMHPPDLARWLAFALANGAKIISDDGKSTDINSPAAVESLQFYYGMYKDGIAGRQQDVAAGWPGEAFGKKRAAAVIEGGWLVPFLADPKNGFDVKYEAAALPKAPSGGRGNLLFTNAYSASANSKFPKAAAALVIFLSGPENQLEVLKTGFALPTIKNAPDGTPFAEHSYFNDHPTDAVLMDTVNYGKAFYFGPNTGKINEVINQALESVYLQGTDPKQALDDAAAEVNDLLNQ